MYRHLIRDIAKGSTWTNAAGERVVVLEAAQRFVSFRPGGVREPLHVNDFRARFAPLYDRQALRSQFQMTLANLERFNVYWMPGEKRILARSVGNRRDFRVPEGALHVGLYAQPCTPETLLDDLDELLSDIAARCSATA